MDFGGISLRRWLTGAAICIVVLAVGAFALVDIGRQAPKAVPAPALPVQIPAPPAVTHRVTPESEIITEFKEAPPAPVAVPAVRLKPAWAADAARPSPMPRRPAAAPPPRPAPATPAAVVRVAPVPPPASTPAAVRSGPADLCPGQSGFAHSICVARRCVDASLRSHGQCAAVRETEQKIRDRMEQGG